MRSVDVLRAAPYLNNWLSLKDASVVEREKGCEVVVVTHTQCLVDLLGTDKSAAVLAIAAQPSETGCLGSG